MSFNYVGNNLKPIDVVEESGVRYYLTPEQNRYPSVTTVLGYEEKDGITRWKKRVGEEEAKRVLEYSGRLGTRIHSLTELFLLNNEKEYQNLYSQTDLHIRRIFDSFQTQLNNIDNIIALEAPLYSDLLKIAGRTDCIAEYKGRKAIIDFKTSKSLKEEYYIENYFLQGTAYSLMFQERTRQKIEDVVILMVNYDCSLSVFHKNRNDYVAPLLKTLRRVLPNFGVNLEI